MKMKRDEQGRLVFVEMIDGVETVTKIIPKHEEQLYLRRGCGAVGDRNVDFPSKAEHEKMVDLDFGADILMPGGEVDHISTLDDMDRPDHPECRKVETLREPLIKVNGDDKEDEYPLLGVNFDPGEDPENEPIEPQQ